MSMIDYANEQPLELPCRRFKARGRKRQVRSRIRVRRNLTAHVCSNMASDYPFKETGVTPLFNRDTSNFHITPPLAESLMGFGVEIKQK